MLPMRSHLLGLGVILHCPFLLTNSQSYSSGSQYYNNYYYPTPAPASTAIVVVTTTSKPATQAPVTNSNTAPGGAPSNPIFGTNGTVCDTRTAFAAIGCPCMLVNKTCADPNSLCTAISSTSGRKKRFAQRGRKGSPMGNAAKNQCICRSGYKYDSNSNTCIVDCSQLFCNAQSSPSESAYLQGPGTQPKVTYLLFSGTCVLEYQENYSTGKIKVTLAPQSISSYVKQPSFVGPVTLAYSTLGADDNPILNLADATGALVTCATTPAVTTGGLTCGVPVANGAANQQGKASSASTQIDGVSLYDQFVVVPGADKELQIYDQNFQTALSPPTSGFLNNGQTHITKITAIQVLEDVLDGSFPGKLAVYGTDASGVAYLGYAVQTEAAGTAQFPVVSINTQFPATRFPSDSLPLRQQYEGLLTCA